MGSENYSPDVEIEEIKEKIGEIEHLEGYKNLTEYQQRLIKASLYMQARAERGTDYASAFAIVSQEGAPDITSIKTEWHLDYKHEFENGPDPTTRTYRTSQNVIANWYCHAAIAALEYGSDISFEPPKEPEDFFNADYQRVKNIEDVQNMIEAQRYPCVVHVLQADPITYKQGHTYMHSFLVLGRNENNNIVIWEKKGNQLPFRITTLDEVYRKYGSTNLWGVRELKDRTGETRKEVKEVKKDTVTI